MFVGEQGGNHQPLVQIEPQPLSTSRSLSGRLPTTLQGECGRWWKAGHKAVSMTVPPGGGSPFGPWYRHGASHYASGFYFSRCISPSASAQIRNVFAAASPYSFMPGGPPEYAAHLGNRVPTYLRATLAASSNVCTVTPCLS